MEKGRREGGKRLKGFGKENPSLNPLVTIVTVVLNGERYLEETIRSVIGQTHENIEYILIDGGSTDGTMAIIEQYDEAIDYWLSEPDRGIYDAMNKGIRESSGTWINFMNCGDFFYNGETVRELFHRSPQDVDVIYGNSEKWYHSLGIKKLFKAGNLNDLWKGMVFCHQSSFVRSSLVREHEFENRYGIIADFEFFYSLLREHKRFFDSGLIVASVTDHGISDRERVNCIRGYYNVVKYDKKGIFTKTYYAWRLTDAIARRFLRRILPTFVTRFIIRMK